MKYKDSYTLEEVQTLVNWFQGRELPESLQVDEATYSPNLKFTIEMYSKQALIHYENPTFNGNIKGLIKIKEKLESLN